MVNPKCEACGKTVYPLEAITATEKTWHKLCFKCQEEGCGLKLTLKTFFPGSEQRVFCAKHAPKDKPTATTVEGSMSLSNARDAPKVATVSNEKRGDNMERPLGSTVDGDLHLTRAKEAHENSRVLFNSERMAPEMERNLQVADVSMSNAINAPKVSTVNDQVRAGAGERNAQVADLTTHNAINAPKVSTVNDQVRAGAGERNAQVADLTTHNAINAPKLETVNDQVRAGAGERNAQVADLTTHNAINAPKLETINEQIKVKDGASPNVPATIY